MDSPVMFEDRADAGRQLASRLTRFRDRQPVVLALPRGGVPVGFEIAKALHAPLDIVLVRKIGVPWQPELAIGAVADGQPPEIVLNDEIIDRLGIDEDSIAQEATKQINEISRRRAIYLRGRTPIALDGRTAIVVDDGIATGATMRAALKSVRRRSPRRVMLAVPVAAPPTIEALRGLVDDTICLSAPEDLGAIGLHYSDFDQVSDSQVIGFLDTAHKDLTKAPHPSPAVR
jgi:putative phosphoribosyl transferase